MASSENIYIINTAAEPNNVIFSHAEFLKESGYNPVFVFPKRSEDEDYSFFKDYQYILLNFVFSNKGYFSYFISIMRLVFLVSKLFFFKREIKHFFAIDLPGTWACIFLKLSGMKVIPLVNDNFSARYNLPNKIYLMLRAIETLSYRLVSNLIIFPDISRHSLLGSPKFKNVAYIPNILSDQKAPKYMGSKSINLKVLLCGWLDLSRGVELLSDILKNTDKGIEFILVGTGDSDYLKELSINQRVTYVSHVSREENLEIMSNVDINFAFYNPSILINRNALPQKVYDALLVGCPIYINSEVNMTNDLLNRQLCLTSKYFDIESISDTLNDLLQDKNSLIAMSERIFKYSKHHVNFLKTRQAAIGMYKNFNSK